MQVFSSLLTLFDYAKFRRLNGLGNPLQSLTLHYDPTKTIFLARLQKTLHLINFVVAYPCVRSKQALVYFCKTGCKWGGDVSCPSFLGTKHLNMNEGTSSRKPRPKKLDPSFQSSDEEDEPEVFDKERDYVKLINRPDFKNADTIVRMDASGNSSAF